MSPLFCEIQTLPRLTKLSMTFNYSSIHGNNSYHGVNCVHKVLGGLEIDCKYLVLLLTPQVEI